MSFDTTPHASAEGRNAARPPTRACPFCAAPAADKFCGACGRDTTAARRPCARCKRMTPTSESVCWNCGAGHASDMWWKIPLIVFLFLLAFLVSIALALVK